MNYSDWILIGATVAGPILAVQAQKWVERATENRRRKRWIFETIMANRATRLADENIRALNSIDLVFRPRMPWSKNKKVIAAWRSLFGELTQGLSGRENPDQAFINAWNIRCSELYVTLESTMSRALGYTFTDEELRRGIYYPRGHNERENAQLAIMNNLKSLLEGKSALNMRVTELPGSPETAALQTQLLGSLTRAYTEEGALKVSIVNGETPKAGK
jgi:hypothetical protein